MSYKVIDLVHSIDLYHMLHSMDMENNLFIKACLNGDES